jgi:DNA polymerase-3 subunit epsilon
LNHDYGQQALADAEFRVLDLEVTGSDPRHNGIIDLAVVGVHGARVQPLLATLVDPEVPIPGNIQRLTGIDGTMVRGAPTFAEILPQLLTVLDGCIFVAHNASFDYHFLKTCIERLTGQRFTAPHLCTVKLSQRLIEPKNSRKLHHLALQFGIPLQNRHRAYDDALATAHILVALMQQLHVRQVTTVGEMKLFESSLVALEPASSATVARAAEPPAA